MINFYDVALIITVPHSLCIFSSLIVDFSAVNFPHKHK